jgi:aspartyl/asparaginyl beta-hydroxylase (cupin superfamily)
VLPPYIVLFLFIRCFEKFVLLTKNGRATFLSHEDFPWTAEVRRRWPEMRAELDRLLQNLDDVPNFQDIQVEERALTTDDKWKTYVFCAYGLRAEQTCRECPRTAEVISSIPTITTAMFSILAGNKRIPPHRGPYKGVLRYHLGLKVPADYLECGIRVGKDVAHWEEGKDMIFDDTHEHEAWNNTSEVRVVLFVDFLRPLPFPLAQINSLFIWLIAKSPFIQDAKERLDDWYETVSERQAARQAERQLVRS